jgi:hypothetical protein
MDAILNKLNNATDDVEKVYEAGKKSQYDEFWDNYQQNGNRSDYLQAFAGRGWDDDTFNPKYDIKPITTAERMFQFFGTRTERSKDFVEILKNVTMDFSNCERMYYTFFHANVSRIGTLDVSAAVSTTGMLSNCTVETIEKMVFSSKTDMSTIFNDATSLKNINETDGIISSSFVVKQCPLTKTAFENLVRILSDETTGLACTWRTTYKNKAFTDAEWNTLIATKPNWTFAMA